MAQGESQRPPIYECHPPEWLPKVHGSADLGFTSFYPPRPDQEEEVLTEGNVKNGLVLPPAVPAETYSAKSTVGQTISSQDVLTGLEDLMSQIFTRKAENAPPIPPSSFKLPSRVTMNDARRQQWFNDLANPDVPLHKLGKSVPHGAKGHDLLDLLHKNNVAIPRAVWFLRVFGGNETAGLRNKPQYVPTQYSVDWANVVVGYLKKQLTQIVLPMASRLGLTVKSTFKGVLAEQPTRDEWISRFTYSLSLLRAFYAEGLVDHRTFLAWLVQQTSTSNLAQLGFVAHLADEYLDGMLICRALMRPFVEACIVRLSDIRLAPSREYLANLEALLKSLVLRSLLGLRDAFVNPRLWSHHSLILEDILAEQVSQHSADTSQTTENVGTPALNETFLAAYADVKKRNDAMLFRNLPPRVLGSISSALSDIKLLNSLASTSCMESCTFFDGMNEPSSAFAHKLDILLTWSITPLQYGDHRPYAAVSLLQCWRVKAEDRAIRRDRASPNDDLQDYLFDWLDSSEIAGDENNLASVALLFDQLVKHGLFDYGMYIQRLIARGEQGLLYDPSPSRHRKFLQWIPLHISSASLLSQRKVTLYGLRVRETPEDLNEREIRKQIRAVLPELFNGESSPESSRTADIASQVPGILTATRFEQVRLFRGWLLPILKKAIAGQGKTSLVSPTLRAYCAAVILMAHSRHYGIILEITLFALEHARSKEALSAVLQTLRQHLEIWSCLNKMKPVADTLYVTHNFWKTQGVQSRDLLELLFAIDQGVILDSTVREQLSADRANFTRAFHPTGDQTAVVPNALPEILLLPTDLHPDAPSTLANSLWYKYRSASDWAWKVWDNTVASLRQIPSMVADLNGRRECALRYSFFLIHVDRHLATGLDEHVLHWLRGSGRHEIAALSAEAWDLFMIVLIHLASYNSLKVTTILEGLVYPTWQYAANLQIPLNGTSLEITLPVINNLCSSLLLLDKIEPLMPPSDILEFHGLQTGRRDVYRDPYFTALINNIPTLVLLEQNPLIPEPLRQNSAALREAITRTDVFRLGTYRELDAVHNAFQIVLCHPDVPEEKHESLVSALKFIFNEGQTDPIDSDEGWKALSTFLSPWKLAATSIELRFTIRQLGEALQRPLQRDKAERSLSRLSHTLFGRDMDSEQADFVAEMIRGANSLIIGKFVDAGLRRIAEILKGSGPQLSPPELQLQIANAGKVLRLLTNLVEPVRATDPPSPLPQLDASVQQDLVSILHTLLQSIVNGLSGAAVVETFGSYGQVAGAAIFLARVLQFDLGFSGVWTQWMKDRCDELCKTLSQLIIIYGSGQCIDIVTFHLLLDTLYYLLDEIPVDPKATVLDPFRCYPTYELRGLPADMPMQFRDRIRSLLPYVALSHAVADLVYIPRDGLSHADPSGPSSESSVVPVQHRPWEWTEYLGEISAIDAAKENVDTRAQHSEQQPLVRNSASLPLDLFGTCVIGKLVQVDRDSQFEDPGIEGNLRMLQDDLCTESVFKRDFRETRIDPSVLDAKLAAARTADHEAEGANAAVPSGSERPSSSRLASPVGSTRSRGSMQPPSLPSGSRRSSPAVLHNPQQQHSGLSKLSTGSSAAEPIVVDDFDAPSSLTASTGTKRKTADVEDDDDVQIIEGPVPVSQAKKAKGRAKPRNR